MTTIIRILNQFSTLKRRVMTNEITTYIFLELANYYSEMLPFKIVLFKV